MITPHQQELLLKEDWRFHAIDAVGTGLGMLASTERIQDRNLSFGLPSTPALYLALAREAYSRRQNIDIDASFVEHPEPRGIWPENHSPLFDFFQALLAEIIFSFTAIEAFANESVPKKFEYLTVGSDGKQKTVSGQELERVVSINEKLKRVLPQAHSIKSPAGTQVWEQYLELKRVRDRVVHMKSIDRKSSGPEHQTIWGLMLSKRETDFAEIAYRLIGSYVTLVQDRRWYRLYTK